MIENLLMKGVIRTKIYKANPPLSRTNRHDGGGGGDGDGGYQLNGNDGINLADEGPSEVRRLQHHWETGAYSLLHVRLPVGVIPHHIWSGNRRRVVLYALFSSSGCTRKWAVKMWRIKIDSYLECWRDVSTCVTIQWDATWTELCLLYKRVYILTVF